MTVDPSMKYPEASSTFMGLSGASVTPVRPTITENLERERKQILQRLGEIDEALSVLVRYPDVQKVLDVIAKTTRF